MDAFLSLPYEILIPNTLFEDELLKFTGAQKRALIRAGLKVVDLPGERVLRGQEVVRRTPRLSIHDGFAFALAEDHDGSILLTGDGSLRDLATHQGMEVHGVLWVVDEIHTHGIGSAALLHKALLVLADDQTTRLPNRELTAYIRRYQSLR